MKKLIGYGYTNSSGVATMTKNASGSTISGYVGTGAGLMNFRAEMHDDSTVVSQPYPVWDTVFHLECTSETSNWSYNDARVSASFDSDGGHFTGLESTTYKYVTLSNNGARFLDGTKSQVIEYDIKKSYAVRLALLDNSANSIQLLYFGGSYSNDWNHIKLVYDASNHTVTPYVNDTALTPIDVSSYTLTTFGITFMDNTTNQLDFYLKDIKIYYG